MNTTITTEQVDAAIQTLRDLKITFEAVNDPSIRLQIWARMEVAMRATKALEMEMRKAVFPSFFKHEKGTENRDLGGGFTLKGEMSINYKVDPDKYDEALDAIEALGERGAKIAEDVIRIKPELSVTEYNKLLGSDDETDKKALAIVQTVVTSSPGSPALSIVPPKT